MRIYGPNGTTSGSPTPSARRTSSTGFSLQPDAQPTSDSRSAVAPKASANIDALLAMQGVEEDPLQRRKRSVKRGNASTVARLRAAAADLKASSGDPGLDAVLSEIELRVEVELAKAGQF
jgi:hypothetical protein